MIRVENLVKRFPMAGGALDVLKGVSFAVADREFVSITGPSGSGKSTVMNILGCLDTPSSGTYRLAGRAVEGLSDDELSDVRAQHIGFVFQRFCLIKYLSVLENVLLPLEYLQADPAEAARRAREMLERVRLGHRLDHLPHQLSGGECQRVAIARALVKKPGLILADEPTGNLDSRVQDEVIDVFRELNRDMGVTIVVVTHSPDVAARTARSIVIRDGEIQT